MEIFDDNKIWTFSLRRDAKWSNGETVKAQDFVRSWKRLAEMGEKAAHHELLSNIVGTRISVKEIVPEKDAEKLDVLANTQTAESLQVFPKQSDSNSVAVLKGSETKTPEVEKNTGRWLKLNKNRKRKIKRKSNSARKQSIILHWKFRSLNRTKISRRLSRILFFDRFMATANLLKRTN
jgi:hypothetical protein